MSFSFLAFAQQVKIEANAQALSDVFYHLRDQYQIQFAFNAEDLKDCFITKSAVYNNPEEAVADIISDCPLNYKLKRGIFVIVPKGKTIEKTRPPNDHYYSGFIADATIGESLPSAVLKFNNGLITSDASGYFNFKSQDSIAKVQIQYLGYYTLDTLLYPSQDYKISMKASDFYLQEFEIKASTPVFNMISGIKAGNIKLNQKTSRFLPGNMDNGIYNMLRLQPGIMAAGEQNDDYTIWGSWPGQNIIQYDHIKLFNISSFDGNQSIVHPLMTKEIDVTKGAFSSEYGNGVGGLVNITGKNGDYENFHGNANINNQAASGYLSIPIANKLSLQTAYRQTFYNIFQNNKTNVIEEKGDKEYFIPEMAFRDFNVKLSGRIKEKDHFFVNILASDDTQEYGFSSQRGKFGVFTANNSNHKTQVGASAEFNKYYKHAHQSKTLIAWSELKYNMDFSQNYENSFNDENDINTNSSSLNQISELRFQHEHQLLLGANNHLSLIGEFVRNTNSFYNTVDYVSVKDIYKDANRAAFILQDEISGSDQFKMTAGLRMDYHIESESFYLQPRLNMSYYIVPNLKFNAAFGKYNQFIYKSTILTENNILYDFWEIIDDGNSIATSSYHYTAGLCWNTSFFQLNAEAFYKSLDHMYSYRFDRMNKQLVQTFGEGRIQGIDFYIKTYLKKHEFWASYTFGLVEEKFDDFLVDEYKIAPHNQTHELKGAAIFNFSPFYISANYVYGSGLQFTRQINDDQLLAYHRLDASAMYKVDIKKVYFQFGISVLNVLDSKNVKYNDIIRIPGEGYLFSQTTPFTALLNIYIGF
jgi:hypothetical protein